jgi:hypothetical protein
MPVGSAAIGFSAVYLASDVLEVGQSHFSAARLVAAASGLSVIMRTVAEAVPAAAFIGMGLGVLRGSGRVRR